MESRRPPIGLVLAAAMSLTACGASSAVDDAGPSPEELAYAEEISALTTTTILLIDGAPEETLPPEQELLVHFEADWVCELQRRTFATPAAMGETLDEKLAANGITQSDYEAFRGDVANSQNLRDWILFVYQENCRA